MKRISVVLAALFIVIIGCSGKGSDTISGVYKKVNGEVTIKKLEKDKFTFSISTSVDMSSCK